MRKRELFSQARLCAFLLFALSLLSLSRPVAAFASSSGSGSGSTSTTPATTLCIDCAIVGGGPSGLATAIALSKASPTSSLAVFEKDAYQPKGASIQISKAGWKSIKKLDETLISALDQTSVPVTAVEMKPWTFDPTTTRRKGFRSRIKGYLSKIPKAVTSMLARAILTRVHLWHDVRMVLADRAVHLHEMNSPRDGHGGPLLYTNFILRGIVAPAARHGEGDDDDDERFVLTFHNEETGEPQIVKAKYVFACDGTKSAVRSILPNEPDTLLAENKSVWRGMAPHFDCAGKATFYRGAAGSDTAGRSALIFPGGKDSGSSWTVISDIEDGRSESQEEAKRRVINVIESMGTEDNPEYDALRRIIEDSSVVIENKLHVRDFDQPWESAYDGLVYLGDAAHPVRPTGEGTALAFEDANVLGRIVSENGLSADALRKYESERYLPVKTISEKIRESANNFYKPEGKVVQSIS